MKPGAVCSDGQWDLSRSKHEHPGVLADLRQAFWHPKGEISINRPRPAVRGLGLKIGPKKKIETPTARSGGRGPAVGIVAGPGKIRCGELWRLENA